MNKNTFIAILLFEIQFAILLGLDFYEIVAMKEVLLVIWFIIIPLYFLLVTAIWLLSKIITKKIKYLSVVEWTYLICVLGHFVVVGFYVAA